MDDHVPLQKLLLKVIETVSVCVELEVLVYVTVKLQVDGTVKLPAELRNSTVKVAELPVSILTGPLLYTGINFPLYLRGHCPGRHFQPPKSWPPVQKSLA